MAFDPFTAGFDLVKTALDKIFPDADAELKGKLDQAAAVIDHEFQLTLGQLKINETEAGSQSFFVAGARPAIMWIGAATLGYSGIGISLFSWIGAFFGAPPLPIVDPTAVNNILMGLLGLGGMRTVEKLKGVATTKIGK
jgi:hypothetical protein